MGPVVDVLACDEEVELPPAPRSGGPPVACRPPGAATLSPAAAFKRSLQAREEASEAAAIASGRSSCATFLDLFGRPVQVPTPSNKVPRRGFRPWSKLEPSEIDHLTKDEICHYERELGFSAWRSRAERLARLEKLAQTNTLPHQPKQPIEGDGQQLDTLQDFLARPAGERCRVTGAELKRLERLAFIVDNELLNFAERRKRLLDQLWAAREAASAQAPPGQQASLLTAWGLAPRRPSGPLEVALDDEYEVEGAGEEGPVEDAMAGAGPSRVGAAKLAGVLGTTCSQISVIDVPLE